MNTQTNQINLKLGTRRSLLATAQSQWVAREIERLNPGVKVELVGIDTRGDKVLDVPLSSIEGKEFFVAELDDALRSQRVDFTVHSMKDLSLDRPKEFVLGAIPKREQPHDVLVYRPGLDKDLADGKISTVLIGTSSPRRLENLPAFLQEAIPYVKQNSVKLDLSSIRGNVNTRLSKLHETGEKRLDGVVLALAGLNRLCLDKGGAAEPIRKLMEGTRVMVIPLSESPTAPAQGALAIECLAQNESVREALSRLHDLTTEENVAAERSILAEWGGGCHQKLGATQFIHSELGEMMFIKGRTPEGKKVDSLDWVHPMKRAHAITVKAWNGFANRTEAKSVWLGLNSKELPAKQAIFVAHSRAVLGLEKDHSIAQKLCDSRIWTAGVDSWAKLAEKGVWVEGCAEGMGLSFIAPLLRSSLLQLSELSWSVLTHAKAAETIDSDFDSLPGKTKKIGTYRLDSESTIVVDEALKAAVSSATHVYWSSLAQARRLQSLVSSETVQCCGPGKTAVGLRQMGVSPVVFPTAKVWEEWIKE